MILIGFCPRARAIIADPNPFEFIQPDGSRVTLRLRGDEFYHWQEDTNGFTIVRQGNRFVYATLDAQQNLVPTVWQAGQVDPRTVGLTPGILLPPEKRLANQNNGKAPYRPWAKKGYTRDIAAVGTVKNLVILCKFSDHTLGVHTRNQSDYDTLFNKVGGDPALAPTGSVKDAYATNSYGIVDLQSTVLAWVTLPQTQAYYAGTNNGLGGDYPNNVKKMVQDALAAAAPLVNFADFDSDNDGYVDAIDFIHSGYGAEQNGAPVNSIWSHKSGLPTDWVSSNVNANGVNVKVNLYHTEPALYGTSGTNNITHIGVICHETGHFFGLPDLYDINGQNGGGGVPSKGIGNWCMMANSWGWDGTQLQPPPFSAWCRIYLGWSFGFPLTNSGTYSIAQSATSSGVYKISANFPANEYLLIENRQPVGSDTNNFSGGLAIWHIDENVGGNTQEGFPGQPGWPANGNHYKVALLQADGYYELEKNINNGNSGDLFRAGGIDAISLSTLPEHGHLSIGHRAADRQSHLPGQRTGFHHELCLQHSRARDFRQQILHRGLHGWLVGFPLSPCDRRLQRGPERRWGSYCWWRLHRISLQPESESKGHRGHLFLHHFASLIRAAEHYVLSFSPTLYEKAASYCSATPPFLLRSECPEFFDRLVQNCGRRGHKHR